VKELSGIQASHVNSGTSFDAENLTTRVGQRRLFRHGKLTAELEGSDSSAYGGLSLAVALSRFLKLPQLIDKNLSLLQQIRPYTESDHVLTHAYNLFLGGNCIEDISNLQMSESARRMVGTSRIPDPTTAGDFLRRFDAENLNALNRVLDESHERVWHSSYGRKRRKLCCVDLDSHVKPVYGSQKEGADFTYKGSYGYHPLVVSLAETGEVLRALNRWGNVTSEQGAGVLLEEVFPLLERNFNTVIVRGDSAFATQEIFDVCEEHGQYFAMVSPEQKNFAALAESLPAGAWKPFLAKDKQPRRRQQKRRRREDLRRITARKRGKRDLKLQKQWIAEISYQPARSDSEYRLVIRKQKIEESNQGKLFELYRYRFVLTNLTSHYSAEQVMRLTYQRCDQENIIEQLQSGVSAMRMPAGDFNANSAFLVCARLAHNMKAWLGMLALPAEVMRWEWKRFRLAFVYFAARVIYHARQIVVRIAESHRFAAQALAGIIRLQV